MFVSSREEIVKQEISDLVSKQVLVGPAQGWDSHVMRLFTLKSGGKAPHHAHPWQHIIYALEGEGNLMMDGKDYPLNPHSVAYVPADIIHQISNRGETDFVFICIVPEEGDR
ncbi:MAG: cupin domain-containing protein [Spirochaetia bacterium]|nr:cupin domain-containing protein [Spirochaetia bacterium]